MSLNFDVLADLGAACLLSLEDHPAELRAAANRFPANDVLNVCFAINTLLSDASDTIVDLVKVKQHLSHIQSFRHSPAFHGCT